MMMSGYSGCVKWWWGESKGRGGVEKWWGDSKASGEMSGIPWCWRGISE